MTYPTIRRGSNGLAIAEWQKILVSGGKPTSWSNARGESRSWPESWAWPIGADGDFGERTEAATEAWQAARSLVPDGVVGPATWGASLGIVDPDLAPLLYGTDVSAIQGDIPDPIWAKIRDVSIRFAMIRMAVGNESWIDARAAQNIERARGSGIVPGAYFFAFPLPHINPQKQVDEWIKRVAVAGTSIGDLVPAMDLEWPPRETKLKDGSIEATWLKWGCSASQIRDWIVAALARGEELTGQPWLRYSYRYWLSCVEAERAPELGNGPLWLADYFAAGRWPTAAEVAKLSVPKPWAEITLVQHDGNAGLKLPSGVDADFNVMTGGEERLAALTVEHVVNQPQIALEAPQLAAQGIMPDEAIAAYRRERIDTEPNA